jgi:hypothetical protein
MHSTVLRGVDFRIVRRGEVEPHERFFRDLSGTDRIGIVTHGRLDALGTLTLLMAHVTAFYDRYRETGAEFFAYPDYFVFQRDAPVADYGMCDIWPQHKNVLVPPGAAAMLQAVTDRAVSVLLVPEAHPAPVPAELPRVGLESARRTVRTCWCYSASGGLRAAECEIETAFEPLAEYARRVIASLPPDHRPQDLEAAWSARPDPSLLRQSFRRLVLEEALALLGQASGPSSA